MPFKKRDGGHVDEEVLPRAVIEWAVAVAEGGNLGLHRELRVVKVCLHAPHCAPGRDKAEETSQGHGGAPDSTGLRGWV